MVAATTPAQSWTGPGDSMPTMTRIVGLLPAWLNEKNL
jgi:hypothetical protein